VGGTGSAGGNIAQIKLIYMPLQVIKIGGNIIDDEVKLSSFLKAFAAVEGSKILVHGGGKVATDIGRKLDIEPNYVNGRRITDAPTLDLVTMVYGGLINKNIVARLQSFGCNAIGLTGADGSVLPAVKRPVKDIDYGFVGDVTSESINNQLIKLFLQYGLVPVFAPLTHDGQGNLLNTNADTIAQELAKSMAQYMPVQLIYCFEKRGVLIDANDDDSVISSIAITDFNELKEKGLITGGMIPKLENAFTAIDKGVEKVIIGHADELPGLVSGKAGTWII
jgi:acetylglutamate kinase